MKTYSTTDIALMIDVTPQTVSRWIDSGKLKGHRIPDSLTRRVVHGDLMDFLAANKIPYSRSDVLLVDSPDNVVSTVLSDELCCQVETASNEFEAGIKMAEHNPRVVIINSGVCPGLIKKVLARKSAKVIAVDDEMSRMTYMELRGTGVAGAIPNKHTTRQLLEAILAKTEREGDENVQPEDGIQVCG